MMFGWWLVWGIYSTIQCVYIFMYIRDEHHLWTANLSTSKGNVGFEGCSNKGTPQKIKGFLQYPNWLWSLICKYIYIYIYHISYIKCHISYIICYISHIIYHISYVICHISYIYIYISHININHIHILGRNGMRKTATVHEQQFTHPLVQFFLLWQSVE